MLGEQLNNDEARGLLSAIDKMREVLHGENITLPEIVVVGEQSVGKSSILEAISGIQLPRAQDICTRCPLELRMKRSQDNDEHAIIHGSVNCTTKKRIDDLTKIADEVTYLTSQIAGEGANVSSNPIYLTVYKCDILYDLTLIDLPGITRCATKNQAHNIHEQILDLINKYIEPSTAIVLHVIPATTDFTTSESMKLAKVFDPLCERQLIAASKIDKYDPGVAEKLQGRGSGSMNLQLGCVAVLNRNQDEIDQNISFEEMKQREKQFFIKHKEAFQHLPDEYKGSEQLVRRLATIQQERIRSTFPDIIKELKKQIADKKAQLKKIPAAMDTEAECWASFQSMINAYRESIHDNVKGEYDQVASAAITEVSTTATNLKHKSNHTIDMDADDVASDDETSANDDDDEGFLIDDNDEDHIAYHMYQLQRKFQDACRRSFTDFFSSEYHKIVLREIDRTAGVALPNFPSYQIIVGLFRREFKKIPNCCLKLVDDIYEYMSQCLLRLFEQSFDKDFPRLKGRLKEVINKRLNEVKDTVLERVLETLDMERRVFTLNHYYMDTVNKLKEKDKKKNAKHEGTTVPPLTTLTVSPFGNASVPSFGKAAAPSIGGAHGFQFGATPISVTNGSPITIPYATVSNEAQSAQDIQIALEAYSKVVEKRLTDTVSQTCYYHFITKCALKIDELLTKSMPSSQLVQYMREPQKQTNLRNRLIRSIQAYEEALQLGLTYM